MNLKKLLVYLLFLGLPMLFSACFGSDNRVLGSIDGKTYTVDKLLSLFLSPQAIKEAKKNFTDEDLAIGFDHLASFVVFAGEADKTQFFDKNPEAKKKLDMQTKQVYQSSYQKYINEFILSPMLDKITVKNEDLAPYRKRVQVRHILLSKDGAMKDESKGQALAQQIIEELDKGGDFGELAKKYSEDPGSKDAGGLIPEWIYANSPFVTAFKEAALGASKKGQIIPDVKTEYGTHIIYVEDLQNRSAREIRKNDPQLYGQILEEKKSKKREEFTEQLIKEFPVEVNKNVDFKQYFSNYSNATAGTVLYTIDNTISYTGADFVNGVLQGDSSRLKTIFRQNPNIDMEQIVKTLGVIPSVEELYVKKKGIDKEERFQNTLYTQLLALKAGLYLDDLVKVEGPKQQSMPVFSVSDKEVQDFYNKAISPEEGKEPVAMPLTEDLKKNIRNRILEGKREQFKHDESRKVIDFIQKKSESLYEEYRIIPNKNFLKKKEEPKEEVEEKKEK